MDSLHKIDDSYIVDIDSYAKNMEQLLRLQKSKTARQIEQILKMKHPPNTTRINKIDSLITIDVMVDNYLVTYFFSDDPDFVPPPLEDEEYYSDRYYSHDFNDSEVIYTGRINPIATYSTYK